MIYSERKKIKVCKLGSYDVNYYSSEKRIKLVMTMKYSDYKINWYIHKDKNIPDIIEGNEALSRAHFHNIFNRQKLFKNGFHNKFVPNGGTISTNEAMRRLDTNILNLGIKFENAMKCYLKIKKG